MPEQEQRVFYTKGQEGDFFPELLLIEQGGERYGVVRNPHKDLFHKLSLRHVDGFYEYLIENKISPIIFLQEDSKQEVRELVTHLSQSKDGNTISRTLLNNVLDVLEITQ